MTVKDVMRNTKHQVEQKSGKLSIINEMLIFVHKYELLEEEDGGKRETMNKGHIPDTCKHSY